MRVRGSVHYKDLPDKVARFDGSGATDYAEVADVESSFGMNWDKNNFYEFWINLNTIGATHGLIGKINENFDEAVLKVDNNGVVDFYWDTSGDQFYLSHLIAESGLNLQSSVKLKPHRWYHIALYLSKSSSLSIKLWIDGALVRHHTSTSTAWSAPPNFIYIGSENATTNVMDGWMSRIRMYEGLLTQNDIWDSMCGDSKTSIADLRANWELDNSWTAAVGPSLTSAVGFVNSLAVSTTNGMYNEICWDPRETCDSEANSLVLWYPLAVDTNDKVPGTHPLVPFGSPIGIATDSLVLNNMAPYSGQAISDNGVPFPTGDFSFCIWIEPKSFFVDTDASIFEYHKNDPEFRDVAITVTENKINIYVNGISSPDVDVTLQQGQWAHLCVTRHMSKGRLKVFVNGANVYTGDALAYTGAIETGGTIFVGGHQLCYKECVQENTYFSGSLADFMIFKEAIRQREIQILWDEKMFVCGQPSTSGTVCNGWVSGGSSRGTVNIPGRCDCDPKWTGAYCQFPVCNTLASNDPDVCHGNGKCEGPDQCTCNEGWAPSWCEHAICFTKTIENGDVVCSGNGNCVAPNTCQCEDGWIGEECQYAICGGIPSNATAIVCSGHGDCNSPSTCTCHDGWAGELCDLPICNGDVQGEEGVCSGHGDCNDKDRCDCHEGWTGDWCQDHFCFGIIDHEDAVCSSNGTCVSPNHCECFEGYRGGQCETPICFGYDANNSSVCSTYGECVAANRCVCELGWSNPECDIPVCYNIKATDGACNGHGECLGPNSCQCFFHWAGDECGIPMCDGVRKDSFIPPVCSGNGKCIDANVCDCTPGWDPNSFCQYAICDSVPANDSSVCSGNGDCLSPDNCACNAGWEGENCKIPICNGYRAGSGEECSQNGVCDDPDDCQCFGGWAGSDCQFPLCNGVVSINSTVCSSHGTCNGPDTCECFTGWKGTICEFPLCFSKPSNDPEVCSGNGECISPGKCECEEGWVKGECNVPICHKVQADSGSPPACSGHGSCKAPDNCMCETGWTGDNCDMPICYGLSALNSTQPCNNHGDCADKDLCKCNEEWTGSECEVPICFGIASTDPTVCSSNGSCETPNVCTCDTGHRGQQCEKTICFGINHDNNTVCSGNGNCIDHDTCTCAPGWVDDTCQMPVCSSIRADDPLVCSVNGSCIAPDTCICEPGRTEEGICAFPLCFGLAANETEVCHGHGSCLWHNMCACHKGYAGEQCQNSICFDIISNENDVCSGHGDCASPNQCNCEEGYIGDKCEIPTCYGIPRNASGEVCHGNGTCIDYDVCDCLHNFSAPDCAYPICFGILANETSAVCSVRGSCLAPNNCLCDEGFYDSDCSNYDCYNISFSDESVCSSHGVCALPDQCECEGNWTGSVCETSKCNGMAATDPTVCSGFGVCENNHTCTCDILHYGHNCQEILPCYPGYFGKNCEFHMSPFEFSSDASSMFATLSIGDHDTKCLNPLNCNDIFTETSMTKVGRYAQCSLHCDSNRLVVAMGSDATVLPYDEVHLTILMEWYDQSNETAEIVRLRVLPSKQPKNYVRSTITAKDEVSLCAALTLDGISKSMSPDSRSLSYQWSFIKSSYPVNDKIKAYISRHNNESVIEIRNDMLVSGFTYTFGLQVTNFLGQTSALAQQTVFKKLYSIAMVSVNPAKMAATRDQPIWLHAKTELDDCFYNDKTLLYNWQQTGGPAIAGWATSIAVDHAYLMIPAGSLKANSTDYAFKIIVTAAASSLSQSNATAQITVLNRKPVLTISGGDRYVNKQERLLLLASCSDPEESDSTALYSWTCLQDGVFVGENGSRSCDFSVSPNSPVIAIGSNTLSSGHYYTFFVTCRIADRMIKGSTKIVVSAETTATTLHVSIQTSVDSRAPVSATLKHAFVGKINEEQYGNLLWIPRNESIQYEWRVVRGNLELNRETMTTESVHKQTLVLRENVLEPGSTYTLSFKASGPTIGTGIAYRDISVRSVPIPGLLSITPRNGMAMTTRFTFKTMQWKGNDQILKYQFFYTDEMGNQVRLGRSSQSNTVTGYLPHGPMANNALQVGVEVSDMHGSRRTLTSVVQVAPPSALPDEDNIAGIIQDQMSTILQPNIDNMDIVAVTQLTQLYSDMLNAHPDHNETQHSVRGQIRGELLKRFVSLSKETNEAIPLDITAALLRSITSVPKEVTPSSVTQSTGLLRSEIKNAISPCSRESCSTEHLTTQNQNIAQLLSNIITATTSMPIEGNDAQDISMFAVYEDIDDITAVFTRQLEMSIFAGEPPLVLQSQGIQWFVSNALVDLITNVSIPAVESSNSGSVTTEFPSSFATTENLSGLAGFSEIIISQTVSATNPYQYRDINETFILSPVVTLTLSGRSDITAKSQVLRIENLTEAFVFTMPFPKVQYDQLTFNETNSGYRPSCKYWDETLRTWSSFGCSIISIMDSQIQCACTHLTSFSSSMDYISVPPPPPLPEDPTYPVPHPKPGPSPAPGVPVENMEKDFNVVYFIAGITLIYSGLFIVFVIVDCVLQGGMTGSVRASMTVVDPYDQGIKTNNYQRLFRYSFKKLKEYLLWFSVIFFTHRNFARAQRLTAIYVGVLTMIALNVIFVYLKLNSTTISIWYVVVNGVISNLIAIPLVEIVSRLFIRSEPLLKLFNTSKQQRLALEKKIEFVNHSDTIHNQGMEKSSLALQFHDVISGSASAQPSTIWSDGGKPGKGHVRQRPENASQNFMVSQMTTGVIQLTEIDPRKRPVLSKIFDRGDALLGKLYNGWEMLIEMSSIWQLVSMFVVAIILVLSLVAWYAFCIFLLPMTINFSEPVRKYVTTALITVGSIYILLQLQCLYLKRKIAIFRSGKIIVWTKNVHLQAFFGGIIVVLLVIVSAALVGVSFVGTLDDVLRGIGVRLDLYQMITIAAGTLFMALDVIVWIVFLVIPPPMPPLRPPKEDNFDALFAEYEVPRKSIDEEHPEEPKIRYDNRLVLEEEVEELSGEMSRNHGTSTNDEQSSTHTSTSSRRMSARILEQLSRPNVGDSTMKRPRQRGARMQRFVYGPILHFLEERYWFSWQFQIVIFAMVWMICAGTIAVSVHLSLEVSMSDHIPMVIYGSSVAIVMDIFVTGFLRLFVQFFLLEVIITRYLDVFLISQRARGVKARDGTVAPETFDNDKVSSRSVPRSNRIMPLNYDEADSPPRISSRSGWLDDDDDDGNDNGNNAPPYALNARSLSPIPVRLLAHKSSTDATQSPSPIQIFNKPEPPGSPLPNEEQRSSSNNEIQDSGRSRSLAINIGPTQDLRQLESGQGEDSDSSMLPDEDENTSSQRSSAADAARDQQEDLHIASQGQTSDSEPTWSYEYGYDYTYDYDDDDGDTE